MSAPDLGGRPLPVTDARLDDLQTQARFARQRYDLYKARAYGPHLTSPARMEELERESTRAAERLKAAKAQRREQTAEPG